MCVSVEGGECVVRAAQPVSRLSAACVQGCCSAVGPGSRGPPQSGQAHPEPAAHTGTHTHTHTHPEPAAHTGTHTHTQSLLLTQVHTHTHTPRACCSHRYTHTQLQCVGELRGVCVASPQLGVFGESVSLGEGGRVLLSPGLSNIYLPHLPLLTAITTRLGTSHTHTHTHTHTDR